MIGPSLEIPDKQNRPKDLIIRTDSVESPPYSPLEPKRLNVDMQGSLDLTRPDLKVTTPKGYTPTLTTETPVFGIASVTHVISQIKSPPVSSPGTVAPKKSSIEKEKSRKDKKDKKELSSPKKMLVNEGKEKILSPPMVSIHNIKSPPSKPRKHTNDLLSPKSNSASKSTHAQKSVKSPQTKTLSQLVKKSTDKSPHNQPLKVTEKSPSIHKKVKTQKLTTSESPSVNEGVTGQDVLDGVKVEAPDSPPCLSLPPQIIISPSVVKKEELSPDLRQPLISPMKNKTISPTTPSRTIIFPTRENLPTPIISIKPEPLVLSPDKIDRERKLSTSDDVKAMPMLLSPIPMEMPVLTFQKHAEVHEEEQTLNVTSESTENEVDVMSLSQDEIKPEKETVFNTKIAFGVGEEKKKKKKKKSEKDKHERIKKVSRNCGAFIR